MSDLATSAKHLADLVQHQAATGLFTDDTIRAAGDVQLALNSRLQNEAKTADLITLWLPEQDVFIHQAIGKLLEEMGEAAAIAARTLIQGINEVNPKTGVPNREALVKELADVTAAIRFVQVITMTDRMTERAEAKFAGFSKWVDLIEEHRLAQKLEADG